jgi:nitric-oxide synthase, bacterial
MLRTVRLGRLNYAETSSPLGRRLRQLSPLERREEARAFLSNFYAESGRGPCAFKRRWAEARRSLSKTGTYRHTEEELAFGARVAWRNHGRCIGRIYWESLEVVDCRQMSDPAAMMDRMCSHMRETLGDGRIRSMISVFAPIQPNKIPAYFESAQITQYAGYAQKDGSVIGDRQNVEFTRIAMSLGFRPPEQIGQFDLLPVLIRDRDDRRILFDLPRDCIREVPIVHPQYEQIERLRLKWYAVPCLTGMIMTIGGVDYPCAPFSGFYMATEIASRDFADQKRYDLLPAVGKSLGYNANKVGDSLWKDKALTELNIAVLHSFRSAGVSIIDHHLASKQFIEFHHREQINGRKVAGDWRWIVPPQAPSSCEVFHLRMKNFHPVPNYYSSRADDGLRLMPFYGDQYRSRLQSAYDRVTRRWKLWKRLAW